MTNLYCCPDDNMPNGFEPDDEPTYPEDDEDNNEPDFDEAEERDHPSQEWMNRQRIKSDLRNE